MQGGSRERGGRHCLLRWLCLWLQLCSGGRTVDAHVSMLLLALVRGRWQLCG